jgi:hypothetical protein
VARLPARPPTSVVALQPFIASAMTEGAELSVPARLAVEQHDDPASQRFSAFAELYQDR